MSNFTDSQKEQVIQVVRKSLDEAEAHWKKGGYKLAESFESRGLVVNKSMDAEHSKIPGHKIVKDGETIIDEFVALVADMRGSSKNLMCKISEKKTTVSSGLERVFLETSALLPALEMTVGFEGGSVTEYLGDGILAFFRVDKDNKSKCVYSAHDAAMNSINETREIVNNEISYRYNLPPLDIGIGLAYSKAIVSLTGVEGNKHPKAFGECVFRATKLSGGANKVVADEKMKAIWPTSEGGRLKFNPREFGSVKGYVIN